MSSALRKFTQRRRTARRSTAVAVNVPLFAHISSLSHVFLTALRGFLDMTKHPLIVSPPKNEWISLVFATCASLPRRCIFHSLFVFFYKFSQSSGSEWSRRAATQQTSLKFLVPRKPMKACAIFLVLVEHVATESATTGHFQRWRPAWLRVSRKPLAQSSCRSKALNSHDSKLAARQTQRVDVFDQNLPHVRNSKSRSTYMCTWSTSVEVFVQSATDQRKE